MHTRDCVTLKKQRGDTEQLVDVEWAPDVQGVFDAGIRLLVADRRGLLADLATRDRRRRRATSTTSRWRGPTAPA